MYRALCPLLPPAFLQDKNQVLCFTLFLCAWIHTRLQSDKHPRKELCIYLSLKGLRGDFSVEKRINSESLVRQLLKSIESDRQKRDVDRDQWGRDMAEHASESAA